MHSDGVVTAGLEEQTANHANLTKKNTDLTKENADLTEQIASRRNQTAAQFANLRRRECIRNKAWTPLLVDRAGVNPVGVPPAIFPASRAAVLALSDAEFTDLQDAYNLPAGYFAGATLAHNRNAVDEYIKFG